MDDEDVLFQPVLLSLVVFHGEMEFGDAVNASMGCISQRYISFHVCNLYVLVWNVIP